MPDTASTALEHDKWEAEQQFKRDDLRLRERELDIRERESRRARWTNPLVLAITGAALAAVGNVLATFYTAKEQRQTENARHFAEQRREKDKAESQLILEVVKTASADKAADNLMFLVDTSLVTNERVREGISNYVKMRPHGRGISLPPFDFSTYNQTGAEYIRCSFENIVDLKRVADALDKSLEGTLTGLGAVLRPWTFPSDNWEATKLIWFPGGWRGSKVIMTLTEVSAFGLTHLEIFSTVYDGFANQNTFDEMMARTARLLSGVRIDCPGLQLPKTATATNKE